MRYEALAPFYDRLMNHVEYDEWCQYIRKILKKHADTIEPSILELGGGTGVLGKNLINLGFDYTGSDFSFAMAYQAQKKGCSFICADCRKLPLKKKFDLILFLYDGINYLLTADEYIRMFDEVHAISNQKGLFLFDITTQTNSLRHFTDYLDFNDFSDYSYIRHSYYNIDDSIQINDFTIFKQLRSKAQIYERFVEHHVQKVFKVHEIETYIPKKYFKILGIWDGFTLKRYSSKSERIHFLLQRTN